jgi:hypothetical protein
VYQIVRVLLSACQHVGYNPRMQTTWWDVHQDLVWGGLVGVVATVVVGFIFWRLAEKPKRLRYRRVEIRSLLDARLLNAGTIAVTVGGHAIENAHLLSFQIVNAGKTDIGKDDLADERISMDLIMNSRIEQAGVGLTSAQFNRESVQITRLEHNRTYISFDFLNPGDWFEVQCVIWGRPERPQLHARVRGMAGDIQNVDVDPSRGYTILSKVVVSVVIFILFLFTVATKIWNGDRSVSFPFFLGALLSIIVMTVLTATGFERFLKSKNRDG